MPNKLRDVQQRLAAFLESPSGLRLRKGVRWLFLAGVLAYLLREFSTIGWREMATSLPTHWGFYVIFLVLYFTLPVTESMIYRLCWGTPLGRSFFAFVKKRVYNKDFVGYSGEAYLFAWARKRVALPDRQVLSIIKDNVVLSGFASTLFAVSLLSLFVAFGDLEAVGLGVDQGLGYAVGAGAVVALVVLLGVRFRGRLFTLSTRMLALVCGLHFGRLLVMNLLQVVQWSLVIPGVGWEGWFVFLAVQVIVSRLPLLPSRDLIFLGASLELAEGLGIPRAELATMLVVLSAMDKALNLVLFLSISLYNARHPDPELQEATVPADGTEPSPTAP
jgi:hypothetical protein